MSYYISDTMSISSDPCVPPAEVLPGMSYYISDTMSISSDPCVPLASACADMVSSFCSPPAVSRPHVWWHWMNGNVTREGITADLEAMARIGIGGAQIFDAGCDIPAGPVEFDSEVWYGLLEHAALEARRLGLELCLSNCSGWSNSGGPWVTPELGMKRVVVESARVRAGEGNRFVSLPKPGNTNGFYRDIAVLAFPTPVAEWKTMESAGGVVMTPTAQKTIVAFPEPFAASGLSARFDFDWYWTCPGKLHVDVSNDGVNFTRRETFELQLAPSGENDHSTRYFVFKERLRAKVFRLMTEFPLNPSLRARDVKIEGALRIPNLRAKTFGIRDKIDICTVVTDKTVVIPKDDVVDVTERLSSDNTLEWTPPQTGEWTILRIGFAATGRKNHPASAKGEGLEIDKLSKEAAQRHFAAYVGKARSRLGPLAGNVTSGFCNVLVDSYEAGSQKWTQGFEREFASRRGYSLIPYLPTLAGHVVESMETSERFLEDFRRTIVDLFAELKVNGVEFPVLWCPPYERDITSAVANGGQELVLEIRVTNLWPNRLIGDDRLPSDARWKWADFGMALAEFPAWVRRGEGSPTGRHTFTRWQHWTKDDHLLSSGLLGPVRLRVETLIKSPRNGRSSRKEGLYNGQSCS